MKTVYCDLFKEPDEPDFHIEVESPFVEFEMIRSDEPGGYFPVRSTITYTDIVLATEDAVLDKGAGLFRAAAAGKYRFYVNGHLYYYDSR